jgi:hypothetical protein
MNASSMIEQVSRIDTDSIPWLDYPLIPNSRFKIIQVEESTNTVVLRYQMGANVRTPMHAHHCLAMAYTLDGEWHYDGLTFRKGDLAFEQGLDPHQPYTEEKSAELLTTLIGGKGNPNLLEEFPEEGGSYILTTQFFKALCGISAEELSDLDLYELMIHKN